MIRRLQARRAQARDIAMLDPDRAAQLCRTLTRAGIADRRTLILLAKRGQQSELPGNRAAMEKYEAAIRAGRRIKFSVFKIDNLTTVRVAEDLERAVEEALHQGDNNHD